ncbi:MAG: hypothetical protein HYW01_03835 [Deltaproteobacteria bacterium]|nr:hypothetical protein [Deltaproteobacteria bacterium]
MNYLFWAHVIFWAALFIYVYNLTRKNENLRREIDALKSSLSNTKEEKIIWQKQEIK